MASLSVVTYWDWGRSLSPFEHTLLHDTVPIVHTQVLGFAIWAPILTTSTKPPLAFVLGKYMYLIATNGGGYL